MYFLITVLIVSLIASFIILLLKKLKIVTWMQMYGSKIISDLFKCDFCLSFWTAVIICLIPSIYFGDVSFMAVPFLSTPITRLMI